MSLKGMRQRCWEHDYCAPSFYMITVVTAPRRGCLGVVSTGAGAASDTELELSPIGEVVREVWERTSSVYPEVRACDCVVMPDHFHGILRVKQRLDRHMGQVVKAFKRVSLQECRSRGLLLPPNGKGLLLQPRSVSATASGVESRKGLLHSTLWEAGFQDTILLRRGQLKIMVNYIADNPRRLAAKRANPELFTVVRNQRVSATRSCPAIGNRYLLDRPMKRQVQVSRRISPAALDDKKAELLYAAEHGAVLVSPCISPGEKEIARAALEAGLPLIVLVENGFGSHYKPPGRYFEACAAGSLLMLAPFPHHLDRRTITRQQCLTLNGWAKTIVESDARDD
jgi:REP element-mobilizing transposase RayT